MRDNLSSGRSRDNTETSGNVGNQELNSSPESRARAILGLDLNATYEDAQIAYRRFMMRNHPDKNPNINEETAREVEDITQFWPILKEHLKNK